ncbi:hypothetical protein HPB49_010000 [Dermacentor silvarum]|uniref:Uncharacterized protein n=1 Tax=Dermacentor silvarum TaxID=543639 RepID=A0ACB8DYS3_DERSI|nr:hypothetical protein HPB49_010000 [Dermacentor silvarum]
MIKRITNRQQELLEKDVLHIVQALIISRLTYPFLYHSLNRTETDQMDTILRTAIKAALGLPQHASTHLLLRLGVHNTIQ